MLVFGINVNKINTASRHIFLSASLLNNTNRKILSSSDLNGNVSAASKEARVYVAFMGTLYKFPKESHRHKVKFKHNRPEKQTKNSTIFSL